ncbi:MAG: hypothetical protein MK135_16330, partial [Polyangiaceae bacterium]|nr:hypothetical protein [Polyangiaceae bacterium]
DKIAKFQLSMMSQCPFGNIALESLLRAQALVPGQIALEVSYLGQMRDGQPFSIRGDAELTGAKLGLCAQSLVTNERRKAAFFSCFNRAYQRLPDGWEKCAKAANVEVSKLRGCAEGLKGRKLVEASFAENEAANITASPTLRLNGQSYTGGRHSRALALAACDALKSDSSECLMLRDAKRSEFLIISDKRCDRVGCDPKSSVAKIKAALPPNELSSKDWLELEPELRQELAPRLPALIIPKIFSEDPELRNLFDQVWNQLADGRYVVSLGEWDPRAEVCGNGADDDDDAKVDCDDEDCIGRRQCLRETPNTLTVFLDEGGAFSDRAYEALELLGRNLADNKHSVKLELVQTGRVTKDGWFPARGKEVEPAVVAQLCLQEATDGWLAAQFGMCQASGGKVQGCLRRSLQGARANVGLLQSQLDQISECVRGEPGKALAKLGYARASALPVKQTPHVLINNTLETTSYSPENLREKFCMKNPENTACRGLLGPKPGEK